MIEDRRQQPTMSRSELDEYLRQSDQEGEEAGQPAPRAGAAAGAGCAGRLALRQPLAPLRPA